jgi:site-specific recombinase XerD
MRREGPSEDEFQSFMPAIIAPGGKAQEAFLEFFAAEITNNNTRESYIRDIRRFSEWCDQRGFQLHNLTTLHLAAYRDELRVTLSSQSTKRHFASLRRLFAFFVERGVLDRNPAREVKTPKVSRDTGKTPALDVPDMSTLLNDLTGDDFLQLRDRAIIAIMAYTFARVSAVCSLKVKDYYQVGRRSYLRLHEKGGKEREIPCNHKLEIFLDEYLQSLPEPHPEHPLFTPQSPKSKSAPVHAMSRHDVYKLVRRRVQESGLVGGYSCHSFRATGITTFLENGGTLERAQWMAGHADSRTTKLYDRRNDRATLEDIERIRY